MDNLVTYAERTLDTFEQVPFNAVDSLILSWITCLRFPRELAGLRTWQGVRFAELFRAELFEPLFSQIWDPESTRRLFTAMAASPRWRKVQVLGLSEQVDPLQEKQFAAASYQLTPQQCYIGFRGTDSSLVGWKEDFNMAYQYPVPSQLAAAHYLTIAAAHCRGAVYVGGHSKGGNLAVYAAANSKPGLKGRIARIFSHDGPGFPESVLKSGAFRSIQDRLDKTVPQSSLVGLLMEHQENYRIIKSTGFSVWQHDPFSWEVDGYDFRPSDTLTPDARYLDKTLNEWMLSLTREEREQFIDTLYQMIRGEDADTFAQLWAERKTAVPSIAQAAARLAPSERRLVLRAAGSLVNLAIKNFPELLNSSAASEP